MDLGDVELDVELIVELGAGGMQLIVTHTSCKLGLAHPLGLDSSKPLLVGSKRTLAGSSRRVGTLTSVGVERFENIEVFHITTTYCIKWFLSIYY